MEPEVQVHDGLPTVVIEEHHSCSHSHSSIEDQARNAKDPAEAADTVDNAMKALNMTRKAEKQTYEAVRETPYMAGKRS